MAGGAGDAGSQDRQAARRRHDPAADRGPRRTVPRNLRVARDREPFIPRDRRCRGSACGDRDVAPRARPRHAAVGMACGTGAGEMTCDEAEILLHALIDGELDAGHAREVEAHLATCAKCSAAARDYREMKKAIAQGGLRYAAPPELRRRIEASLPRAEAPTRRAVLRGF